MICCAALLLTLTSVSAVRRVLNSINDLKSINFGQTVPMHSLVLLYWFASEIDIDGNDVIYLSFDPSNGDYGSHHYGNYEKVLNRQPWGSKYYTIGSINRPGSSQLPPYVRSQLGERNRARIIISVREQNVRAPRVDSVYISQHSERFYTSEYDSEETYEITTNLLRVIREFSMERRDINSLIYLRDRFGHNIENSQLQQIRNMWGHLASLGLLLLIVSNTGPVLCYYNQTNLQAARQRNDSSYIQNVCLLLLVVAILCLILFLAAASMST